MASATMDGCIFCAPSPCTCRANRKKTGLAKRTDKPAEPKAVAQPPAPTPVRQPTVPAAPPKRAGLSAVKRIAPAAVTAPAPVVAKPAPVVRSTPRPAMSVSDDEHAMVGAIQVLYDAGLVPIENVPVLYRGRVKLTRNIRERATTWRKRIGLPE